MTNNFMSWLTSALQGDKKLKKEIIKLREENELLRNQISGKVYDV
jgi:hypothetical protein